MQHRVLRGGMETPEKKIDPYETQMVTRRFPAKALKQVGETCADGAIFNFIFGMSKNLQDSIEVGFFMDTLMRCLNTEYRGNSTEENMRELEEGLNCQGSIKKVYEAKHKNYPDELHEDDIALLQNVNLEEGLYNTKLLVREKGKADYEEGHMFACVIIDGVKYLVDSNGLVVRDDLVSFIEAFSLNPYVFLDLSIMTFSNFREAKAGLEPDEKQTFTEIRDEVREAIPKNKFEDLQTHFYRMLNEQLYTPMKKRTEAREIDEPIPMGDLD